MTEYIAEIDRLYSAYVAQHHVGEHGPEAAKSWSDRREARRLWAECLKAKETAVAAFAALNGWREAPTVHNLDILGRGAASRFDIASHRDDGRLLDHPECFYFKRRFVAVVGQPYLDASDIPTWRDHLAGRGLILHAPTDPFASIHYPGATLFFVVTLRGVGVRFLPEQDGRLAERWSIRAEAEATA
jgi:hypothetical protein